MFAVRRTLSAVPVLLMSVLGVAACSSGSSSSPAPSSVAPATSSSTSRATSAAPTSSSAAPAAPVHVSLANSDGDTYGVGMPIIAWFSKAPTSGRAFNAATTVTVNGQPAKGNWFWEQTSHIYSSGAYAGKPAALEAHWRPQTYWPAHAKVHMNLPVQGVSAGPGLAYDDSLTLDFSTGAANISTVDANAETMTVTSDGKDVGSYPVSLGAANTPTAKGSKVIMEKGRDISMTGPGYSDPHVKFTQRLTYGGEYLHAAPWNTGNIGRRSTSNGCTNLLPADAEKLYNFFIVGDVFTYPNANGPQMRLGDGYGDWNVTWPQWQTGGLLNLS